MDTVVSPSMTWHLFADAWRACDQRTDDAEERRPDDHARDHEEPRDVGRAPLDRRLQHVVLELLVRDADREHDQRLRHSLA